jgi:hypothetical protein
VPGIEFRHRTRVEHRRVVIRKNAAQLRRTDVGRRLVALPESCGFDCQTFAVAEIAATLMSSPNATPMLQSVFGNMISPFGKAPLGSSKEANPLRRVQDDQLRSVRIFLRA